MKLNHWFMITAAYGILLGLNGLLLPETIIAGVLPNAVIPPFLLMITRFWGVGYIGLGIVAWLALKNEESPTQHTIAVGLACFFALHSLTSLYGQFDDPATPSHWFMALVQALIALGLFFTSTRNIRSATSPTLTTIAGQA